MKKTHVLLFLTLVGFCASAISQTSTSAALKNRPISVAVPFLTVPGDARAAGIGDMGIATSSDIYAQQWNAAKYAFFEHQNGIGLSYIPYLRKLTNDINVGQINYAHRINGRSAFAISLRYFNLGKVSSRQTATETGLELKPNQLAVDASYALKLSKDFSMGITLRYIRSDLKIQTAVEDASVANAFSTDISGYFESDIMAFKNFDGQWRAGFNLSNIGPKINYGSQGEEGFLPTNLGIGGGFDFIFDSDHKIGVYTELNKLLVPTPSDSNGDGIINRDDQYYQKAAIGGIFSSFNDAPGGLREELKEVIWAVGTEYQFRNRFSLRTGYLHESPEKGFRQYITFGMGFQYALAEINISYLLSTSSTVANPLEGGIRFSLAFHLGDSF